MIIIIIVGMMIFLIIIANLSFWCELPVMKRHWHIETSSLSYLEVSPGHQGISLGILLIYDITLSVKWL